MKRLTLLTGVAAALAFGGTSAIAQMQQKGPEEKGGAQMQAPPSGQPQGQQQQPQAQQKKQEPSQQGAQKTEPKEKATKGTGQSEPKEKATKGTAEKSTEPKDKAKGTAEKATEPKTKGTAEKAAEPKDKPTKGTAEKAQEPKDKSTKGTAEKAPEPKDKATKGAAEKGSAGRVQLSEQQRTNVSQTLMKDQRVNRVTNVNISVNIGTRVPRSVTLVALPASVISLVPQYRPDRYFVVEERICIVDPATYEIVDIIEISGQTAGRGDHGGGARLVLTEEERTIILSEVEHERRQHARPGRRGVGRAQALDGGHARGRVRSEVDHRDVWMRAVGRSTVDDVDWDAARAQQGGCLAFEFVVVADDERCELCHVVFSLSEPGALGRVAQRERPR